jgi:Lar family restriction alleviation protein
MAEYVTELLPCPFCGGEAELRYHPSSMRDPSCRAWEAGCPFCGARVGSTIYAIGKTRDDAIAAWNRRAYHD